jgi:hypothetical protein
MSREAMTLALDALENHSAIKHPQQRHYRDAAIATLRAALDAPEQNDPIVGTKTWFSEDGKIIQQELKRSEVYKQPEDEPVVFNTLSSLRHKKTVGPIESAMTGRPQTTEEPVVLMDAPLLLNGQPLYTRPQREWVGLTDEEVDDIWNRYCDEMGEASINDAQDIAYAIEKALKEKNT